MLFRLAIATEAAAAGCLFLAQNPSDWSSVLTGAGALGVMVGWFMFRTEGRLKLIENAVDRMSRAQLVSVLGDARMIPEAKEAAAAIIKEIDDAQRKAGG